MLHVRKPILGASVGVAQLCTGIESGSEEAVNAIERDGTEAVMFVDASNAFNSLTRKSAA